MTDDAERARPLPERDDLTGIAVPPRPPLPPRDQEIPPRPSLPDWAVRAGFREVGGRAPADEGADAVAARPWDVRRIARWALAAYAVALVLIAVWPTPVDRGAAGWINAIHRVIPLITLDRVEFAANIVYFAPLGALLALLLTQRSLILPIALVTTVSIEAVQAVLLDARVPSVLDIIANVTGACVGLLLVVVVEEWRDARSHDR